MAKAVPESTPPHRRQFVRGVVGGTALCLSASVTRARAAPGQGHREDTDPMKAEIDARMALIEARYGSKLDEESRKAVRADVASMVHRGKRLKRFKLENGDGPVPVFTPYRGDVSGNTPDGQECG